MEEVDDVTVPDPKKVVCLTQTTLSVDDTAEVIAALKQKFPDLTLPAKEDICYATTNRQTAVKEMAGKVDLLLVLGSRNSSNSMRLKEVGESAGIRAHLIDGVSDLDMSWFDGARRVGVTAGASTPEFLVRELVEFLKGRGIAEVEELEGPDENVVFQLPNELGGRTCLPGRGGRLKRIQVDRRNRRCSASPGVVCTRDHPGPAVM